MKVLFLMLLTVLSVSCNSQEKRVDTAGVNPAKVPETASQIGAYVVETFQDTKGTLWFGTLEKGVATYNGKELVYLTTDDGLPSNRIVNIIEDASGNLWFGTGAGLSKYDGKTFVNYSEDDGLCNAMISSLFIDSKGMLWIGTWRGVCKFDGLQFENFPIPYPEVDTKINQDTKDWVTTITEDADGNIWFGRDGYGASKFDGSSFVHYTTREGLTSNNVQTIVADVSGAIWIGTRVAEKDNANTQERNGNGGLNKLEGDNFTHFIEIEGLNNRDVFAIYKDSANSLWVSTTNNGVYHYSGGKFVNYAVPTSTMSFLKDDQGTLWLGCAGGLYKIDKQGNTVNVTTQGPW
ncbi:ligand-binding sensor domain-containing protein [Mesoflavibacter zeaxanthinifaciens]|uniref:ligand-binding sensor domain-containing protein n=1 Tax=Mesoflavibacter zeaxanthinifaciens TaxID=393060 RepID=UPI003A93FD30